MFIFRRIINHWPALVLLLLGVCLAYGKVLTGNYGFIWDDRYNFIENPNFGGLGWENIRWMFTAKLMGHYIPLSWLSLAIDHYFWGMNPWGYHLTNLILHYLNCILLYTISWKVIDRVAADWERRRKFIFCTAVALIFAVHPTHVESVAWITERRDLLSFLFLACTLLAWAQYVECSHHKRWVFLTLSLVSYSLALLSKSMVMTLPAVLIMLDYLFFARARFTWLKNATSIRSQACLILEKIPFLVLAGLAAYRAFDAANATLKLPLLNRIIQSGYGLVFYIEKTLLPQSLSPLYLLRADFNPLQWPSYHLAYALLSGVVALILIGVIMTGKERWRLIACGLCFYVITLSPVLGLVEAGQQITADRYTYIPCIGLLFIAVYAICRLVGNRETVAYAVFGVIVGTLIWGTRNQAAIWQNEIVFWQHAVAVDPTNYAAATNLGLAYDANGETEQAFPWYEKALASNPRYSNAFLGRAGYYNSKGDVKNALRDFTAALALDPDNTKARSVRGKLWLQAGKLDMALSDLNQAINEDPQSSEVYVTRGLAHYRSGDNEAALRDFSQAIALNPLMAEAYNNRGILYRALGKLEESLKDLDAAIKCDSQAADSYYNRGLTLRRLGQIDAALNDYDRALQLNPEFIQARNNRALIYQLQGKTDLAIADFNAALKLNPKNYLLYQNRGNVLGESEQFEAALSDYDTVLKLRPGYGPALDGRARCLVKLGLRTEARAAFEAALKGDVTNFVLQLEYARFLQEQGQTDAAISQVRSVLDSVADDAIKADASNLMETLRPTP